jgi:hypothetical protein
MELRDLQRELANELSGASPTSPRSGPDPGVLDVSRRRAAGHLLPRLKCILGIAWPSRFHQHAERYSPAGSIQQVDDAWEFAETVAREASDLKLRLAAHDDLAGLRLRYARDPRQETGRIQERRGPVLALLHTPQRAMVVKLPGTPGRLWYVRM